MSLFNTLADFQGLGRLLESAACLGHDSTFTGLLSSLQVTCTFLWHVFSSFFFKELFHQEPEKAGLPAKLEGASRASKELDVARRSKEIEELANVAHQLSQADKDSLDLTSKLSSLLVSLLKTVRKDEDTTEDLVLMLEHLHLPGHLNQEQQQDFEKAVSVIFSSSLHR